MRQCQRRLTGKRCFTIIIIQADKETRQGLKVELRLEEALTFSLGDGGGRGDGAERGAAWEGGVGPGHSHRVAHPRCWVNGSDRFICTGGEEIRKLLTDP